MSLYNLDFNKILMHTFARDNICVKAFLVWIGKTSYDHRITTALIEYHATPFSETLNKLQNSKHLFNIYW